MTPTSPSSTRKASRCESRSQETRHFTFQPLQSKILNQQSSIENQILPLAMHPSTYQHLSKAMQTLVTTGIVRELTGQRRRPLTVKKK